MQLATVASIYKKGDSTNLENYRPIALLQTCYKLPAGMIKHRIADAFDPWIDKMQYGFRKKVFLRNPKFSAKFQ